MLDRPSALFLYYLTLAVSILAIEGNSRSDYASLPGKENGTCYKRVPYDDAIAADISKGIVQIQPGSREAGIKTRWITIIECCEGFARNNITGRCEAHCAEGCLGGTCTGPNVCTCEEGWRAEGGVCKAVCRQQCHENAYCFAPDVCTCKFGYEEENGRCKPACLHDCRNGNCLSPRVCRCHPGYYLNESQMCQPVCEGGCPHGQCTSPGICSCDSGYVNPPNDLETCVNQADSPNASLRGRENQHSPPGRAFGSQGVIESRNQGNIERKNMYYGVYNQHLNSRYNQTQSFDGITGVKGGISQGPYGTNSSYGYNQNNYGYYGNGQDNRPQRPYSNQTPGQTRDRTGNTTPYPIYENEGPYSNQRPNQQPRSQQGERSYGIYPNLPQVNQQQDYGWQSPGQRYPTNTTTPYGIYENQGPYAPYNQTYNRPQIPYNSSQGSLNPRYPNQRYPGESNGPYGVYNNNQTYHRPQIPSASQGPFPTQYPYQGTRENNTGSFGVYGLNRPQGPYSHGSRNGTVDIGTNRRPSPGQFYGNPGEQQGPGHLGVELSYGPGEIYIIDPNSPVIYQPIPQTPSNYDPYNPYGQSANVGSDNSRNQGRLTHGIQEPHPYNSHPQASGTSGIANCPVPCYNGKCDASTQTCRCNQGYVPDSRYPYNTQCVPVCNGGCPNGVCTSPNLCLCNAGFVKEHGVKGSQRCVPA